MLKYRQEDFEDTKGVIRICISKNRQHNGQKHKQRSTKHTHKTKDQITQTPLKTRVNSIKQANVVFFGTILMIFVGFYFAEKWDLMMTWACMVWWLVSGDQCMPLGKSCIRRINFISCLKFTPR